MRRALLSLLAAALAVLVPSIPAQPRPQEATAPNELGSAAHIEAVMTSRFCADCHPAIYAEHQQNTHGRAFFDEEARLATRGFRREDCVRCHTPRPVFETGIGMTPMQRWTNLEEGNTCMSCHGRAGYDYRSFAGGAECKGAFEPQVASVNHCATCHRIAGTPDQWSHAEHGQKGGNECIDCHMPMVTRPVAVGEPARSVRSHLFPASSSESQLRRAYAYDVALDGNEVVVRVTNKGVGHNFPTANRQRGVESLVVVRDVEGREVSRSRMVCRYPYASELEPGQLTLPQSSQIPSGKTSEQRVPIGVRDGSVECRLYFKLYRPSDDTDPHLSRCLEERRLPFSGLEPSTREVAALTFVTYPAGATTLSDFFNPGGLANVARPPASPAPVVVPAGANAAEIDVLCGMLESHLPEVRKRARARLVEAFPASGEGLLAALGRWSNESFNEAKKTLLEVGRPAVPILLRGLESSELYVRIHAREVLSRIDVGDQAEAVAAALRKGLELESPLDRRSAAEALGQLPDRAAGDLLVAHLEDGDVDVVHAAAAALARLGQRGAVAPLTRALSRARWPETRRVLARALADLGSAAGVQPMLDQLDHGDELARELDFEVVFAITGKHFGYEAGAPASERLKARSRLQAWWSANGCDELARATPVVDAPTRARTWELVERLSGGSDTVPAGDDEETIGELLAFGAAAVPALIEGLTFPDGFVQKRAACCELLGRIGSRSAAPFLAAALRDPSPRVAEWACWALESCGDEESPAQLRAFENRVPELVGSDRGEGAQAPADLLLARSARARLVLGDERARTQLVSLLVSRSAPAREIAIGALRQRYGEDRGYRCDDPEEARTAAALRWQG